MDHIFNLADFEQNSYHARKQDNMKRRILTTMVSVFFLLSANLLAYDSGQGNVHPNVKLSFTERLRLVSWDNTITLDDDIDGGRAFTRHRTCLAAQWFPASGVETALKLTNEFRYHVVPENTEFDINEVFVDQLYLKLDLSNTMGGILTAGRQNIILGEGFVVMDSHPLDGSRSIYFNAIRYDWKFSDSRELTLFYSYQPETDEALPVINEFEQQLVEQPEHGMGAYFTAKFTETDLDVYFIRKRTESNEAFPIESDIFTIGGKVDFRLGHNLSLTYEAGYQFGDRGEATRSAAGGHTHIDYTTDWPYYLPGTLIAGAIYLSGDDPATGDWEGWDPMFARWPKWSESYIYSQIKEDAVAYWTNLASLWAGARFKFDESVKLNLDYHHLLAPRIPDGFSAFPGGNGRVRGELLIGRLMFQIDRRLSGHFLWEGFIPGNYYFDYADGYSWIRTELMFSI